MPFTKNWQYYKFCLYGFLKNQRFFEFFLILIFLDYKGLSYAQIGILYSIRFIFRAILEIPSGFIADVLGRRGIMLFAYSVYIASFIGYHFAQSFAWLLIPSILFGIADSFRTGTHKAMIFEYLKRNNWQDQKVAYYGHTRSWSQFGSAISSIIGAALVIFGGGYQYIFLFSLMPYIAGFFLLATYPAYLEGHSGIKMHQGIRSKFILILTESLQSFRNISNIRLAFNIATFTGFYQSAKDYIQIIISAFAVSVPFYMAINKSKDEKEILLIGVIYFIIYFLSAAASRNTNKLSALFNSIGIYLNVLLLAGIIMGLVAGIMYNFAFFGFSLVFFVLIFVLENLRRPAGIATIAEQFDEKILASVLSIESQLSSVIGAIMSLVIGLVADWFGPGLAIMLVALLILVLYPALRIVKIK